MTRVPSVLWLTNLLSPYRLPVWERLVAEIDLTVGHLAQAEPNRPIWRLPAGSPVIAARVKSIPVRPPGMEAPLYVALGLRSLMRRVRPQAVILGGWESPAYMQLLWLARRRHAAVVLHCGSTLSSRRFRAGPVAAIRRAITRNVDSVLAYGSAAMEAAVLDGARPDLVVRAFNSVDVAELASAVAFQRATPREPFSGHRYLFVGQLIPRKNIQSLIEAFARTRDSNDTLAIIGKGPLKDWVANEAVRPDLRGSVEVHGHLEGGELIDQFARAHTLILPSTREVWGLVANEALAAGLHAVVSSSAGVAAEISGMPGVWISDPTPEALSAGMRSSRAAWRGPIPGPAILAQTPAASTEKVLEALSIAMKATKLGRSPRGLPR